MPVRDGATWMSEAVDSVLAQTMPELELLIIDDGSADATAEIAQGYQRKDARVRLLSQPPSGLVAALNCGLSLAQAGLIARLDSDDIALAGRLRRQADYMDGNPQITLSGTWAETIDELGQTIGRLAPRSGPLDAEIRRSNPFVHSSVVFRTDLVRKLGGYRPAFEAAEDYDLWLRLSEHGQIAILPEIHVKYRVHAASQTARKVVRQLFSVRLAQRAADDRRAGRGDPADALQSAPGWDAAASDKTFFAAEARLSRFLSLSDPGATDDALERDDGLEVLRSLRLTHKEREVAQLAIRNLLKRPDRRFASPTLLWHLLRLHPPRALKFLLKPDPH